MKIYSIYNKKYNVNFDLKSDSFYDFIESLKESKKYYHDYCNLEDITPNSLNFGTLFYKKKENSINLI